ncbi:MAG: fumarylacetoacetase [Propylenella sp.]
MAVSLDETHDPDRRSWVESANAPDVGFSLQNLPYCVFRTRRSNDGPRIGVGIGKRVLDLALAARAGLLDSASQVAVAACKQPLLNALMEAGPAAWTPLRRAVFALLAEDAPADDRRQAAELLVNIDRAEFFVPAAIGDFSDFYASIHHATNVGRLFRPETPLLPNYQWVPVGYHGRSSSVRVSGTPVRRPQGQTKAPDAAAPSFGPCRRLDYEAELGFFVGEGNPLGEPIPVAAAPRHVFGAALLNDWSARDIQAWEYQPLGPFLAKSFATTLSPWIVTIDALAPFRTHAHERAPGDPTPLPYLLDGADQATGGLDIRVTVSIETAAMRARKEPPHLLSTTRFADLYWTIAQLVAHQTSNGCNLIPGDLIGSGTISSRELGAVGSMIELTSGGTRPLSLSGGETRSFVEDGDAIILRASAERDGFSSIGFGECRAEVLPSTQDVT